MTRSNRFHLLDALWASVNRIIAIAGKEFVALLKDKGSRLILVVPVIVQAVLFGYGATFNLERVPWTYYDASHSSSSMEVVRRWLIFSSKVKRISSFKNFCLTISVRSPQ